MLFLAIRHLLSRKKQSALILFGIVLGTTAFVSISGVMIGFQSYMLDQLVNNEAQIRISAREEALTEENFDTLFFAEKGHTFWTIPPSGRRDYSRIENPLGWYQRLDQDPEVVAYSPQVMAQVILARGGVQKTARVVGSDAEKQVQVTSIKKYMTQGQFEALSGGGNRLILGEGLLKLLGARVSETILVSTGKGDPRPFKIVGSFRLGIKSVDEGTAFGALADIQKLKRAPNQITDIAIRLRDPQKARDLARSWGQTSSEKVLSWEEVNASTLSIFSTQDFMRNFMTISIIVVAAFGIYNILSVLVRQKRREIAILRAMGYDARDIVRLFFLQGLFLGTLGGILGVCLGYLSSKGISMVEVTSKDRLVGSSNTIMVAFDTAIYVKAMILAFTSAVLSSILPAWDAGKLTPMEIFREGN